MATRKGWIAGMFALSAAGAGWMMGAGLIVHALLAEGDGSTATTNNRGSELVVTIAECARRVGDTRFMSGTVRNAGDIAVNFVTVDVRWRDALGVVDTGSTYAVGREHLRPGDSSRFDYYTDYYASRCSAEISGYRIAR